MDDRTRRTIWLAAAVVLGVVAGAALTASAMFDGWMSLETMETSLGVGTFSDTGTCDLFARNASDPLETIDRTFPCRFQWRFVDHTDGATRLHEALIDLERDRVVEIPGMDNGELEEWYTVRSRMFGDDAYRYTFSDDAGVFTPPPGARDRVTVGLVTSQGRPDGEPRLVLARSFEEVGTDTRAGIETVHWNASYRRERVTWHGVDQYRSEHADAWIDRGTGFLLENRVRVHIEMTPGQMAQAAGGESSGDLGTTGEPMTVLRLDYETTDESMEAHAEEVRRFGRLLGLVQAGPLIALVAGGGAAAIVWRDRRKDR